MKYVAFLRGINVGGKNIIPMKGLLAALQDLPISHTKTYIQSGNILFNSRLNSEELSVKIAQVVFQHFGVKADVMVFTDIELDTILSQNPFFENPDLPKVQTYFGLFRHTPNVPIVEFQEKDFGADRWELKSEALYVNYAHGAGSSKLTSSLLEKALGMPLTFRNRNTLIKIQEMLKLQPFD